MAESGPAARFRELAEVEFDNNGVSVMASYIAYLRKQGDADYEIEFPDLPGCRVSGASLTIANALASDALLHHLTTLASLGYPAPEPSSEEQLAGDARRGVAELMAFDIDPAMLGIANPLTYHTL